MKVINRPVFVDYKGAMASPDRFCAIEVDVAKVLESWRESVFSFEWLDQNGTLKAGDALAEKQRDQFSVVCRAVEAGEALEKPVLGLGLQDNIEIGAGKAVFLTLAVLGHEVIPVHILRSQQKDFKPYWP